MLDRRVNGLGVAESTLQTVGDNQLVLQLPFAALKNILIEMSKNLKDHASGFPDLFIWKKDEYHLYEIKSPNDHLSSQQFFWLNFMQSNGIHISTL